MQDRRDGKKVEYQSNNPEEIVNRPRRRSAKNIYLKWGLGRNLEISFKVCLLDNKHVIYLVESR